MKLLCRAGVLSLSALLAFGQSGSLTIRAIAGPESAVPAGGTSVQPLTIVVEDAGGRPLAGATITFRLPAEGPTGRFASGLLTESLVTGADGKASVFGIRWGAQPGKATVRVTATLAGERAESQLIVDVSTASSVRSANTPRSSGSSRKWLILAGVAGGALAGIAFGMGGKGGSGNLQTNPGAPAQPIVIQPPTISIGKP